MVVEIRLYLLAFMRENVNEELSRLLFRIKLQTIAANKFSRKYLQNLENKVLQAVQNSLQFGVKKFYL